MLRGHAVVPRVLAARAQKQIPQVNPGGFRNAHVVALNYAPEMTFTEIAETLGMSRQNVFLTYARALEKIRRELVSHPERFRELLDHQETRSELVFPDWNE